MVRTARLEINKTGKCVIHGTNGKLWVYHHKRNQGRSLGFSVGARKKAVEEVWRRHGGNPEEAIANLIPKLLLKTSHKTTRTILELKDGKLHAIAQFGKHEHDAYMDKLFELSGEDPAKADPDPKHGHRPDRDPG